MGLNPLEELGLILIKILNDEWVYVDLDVGVIDGRVDFTELEVAIMKDAMNEDSPDEDWAVKEVEGRPEYVQVFIDGKPGYVFPKEPLKWPEEGP